MANTILRIAFAAVLVVSSAGFVYAQGTGGTGTGDVAIVSPDAPLPDMQTVLDQCAVVSPEECSALVTTYLDALAAAGLPDAEFSQQLADFVIALTAIAQTNPELDFVDANIARAIEVAATYAIDPGQREQFLLIAQTVATGGDFQTAAIAPPASPA